MRKRRTLLREVNEQIRRVNVGFDVQDSTMLVLCECEDADCFQRVEVPTVVYEAVRGDADRFVVIAGHEDSGTDRVLPGDDYCVVRVSPPEPGLLGDPGSPVDRSGLAGPTALPAG